MFCWSNEMDGRWRVDLVFIQAPCFTSPFLHPRYPFDFLLVWFLKMNRREEKGREKKERKKRGHVKFARVKVQTISGLLSPSSFRPFLLSLYSAGRSPNRTSSRIVIIIMLGFKSNFILCLQLLLFEPSVCVYNLLLLGNMFYFILSVTRRLVCMI